MERMDRLNIVIESKAGSVSVFERMMGWEQGKVSTLTERDCNEELIEVLSKFKDISARWLLFGEGLSFGDYSDGITQKLTFLTNIGLFLPVMTDEEKKMFEDAIMVRNYTSFALGRWKEWENKLGNLKRS